MSGGSLKDSAVVHRAFCAPCGRRQDRRRQAVVVQEMPGCEQVSKQPVQGSLAAQGRGWSSLAWIVYWL